MRITTPIMLGAFMLLGAMPRVGAQPAPADIGTQKATAGAASPGQRDTYIQKSEEELDDWQAKLFRFDEETKTRARNEGDPAWADLMAALDKAEARAYKLQTVAADGLEDAKVSYEKATSEVADAWGKLRSEDRREKATGD